MHAVCVYCSSSLGTDTAYAQAAGELARTLASLDIAVIYGGAHIGLMGVLADAALEVGGRVIGVIPTSLVESEIAHSGVTELHIVDTIHERKSLMSSLADGFVALPGGFGTLDETFEVLTGAQIGLHTKPVGLLNVNGYFDSLITFLDHGVAEGLIAPHNRQLLMVADKPRELIARMDRRSPG